MREVEADVRADLVRIRVVLEECVKESAGGKSVGEARADQVRCELAFRESDIVATVRKVHVQMVVGLEDQPATIGFMPAIPEFTPCDIPITADSVAGISAEVADIVNIAIIAIWNRDIGPDFE